MPVKYSAQAQQDLCALPECVQRHLHCAIVQQAQYSHYQMPVISWCFMLPDHIYRAIKDYRFSPGYRVIYHHANWDNIIIDRIAARDADPYKDGR